MERVRGCEYFSIDRKLYIAYEFKACKTVTSAGICSNNLEVLEYVKNNSIYHAFMSSDSDMEWKCLWNEYSSIYSVYYCYGLITNMWFLSVWKENCSNVP